MAAAVRRRNEPRTRDASGRVSRPWALIQHVPWEGPGTIGEEARAFGVEFGPRRMYAADPVPSAGEIGGLVVMGGPMGASDDARHANLSAERMLLADSVRAGLPVLGVCLGAQLLAAALGARVYKGPAEEIGFGEVQLTPEGLRDPVLGGGAGLGADDSPGPARTNRLTMPVCHWHGDTYDLPRGAVLLARSDAYANQAFRVGALAYGFQFHLELDRALYGTWVSRLPVGAALDASLLPSVERAGRLVFRRFFELALAR